MPECRVILKLQTLLLQTGQTLWQPTLERSCSIPPVFSWFIYSFISLIISGNTLYYVATIVCTLWLAAKRALFSFNDWALLAMCSRHIQSMFNLIVDILMDFHVNWLIDSCQKRLSTDQCYMTVLGAQVYNSLRWRVFLSYPLTSYWF